METCKQSFLYIYISNKGYESIFSIDVFDNTCK